MAYIVKLIDKNRQHNIFECDTIEEANICAQYYMRNRTEVTSVIYIVPYFDNNGYDSDVASECVKKCRLDEEDSMWKSTTNKKQIDALKTKMNEMMNILDNLT